MLTLFDIDETMHSKLQERATITCDFTLFFFYRKTTMQ